MYKKHSCRTNAVCSRCPEPFKEEESHEVREYGSCCSQLQKKSLIKGFAEIAKSKRCLRRVIKLFVNFICTVGFIYQVWTFLQLYLTYPTTLEISEEYPDSFEAPAITICNSNRLLRQKLCKRHPYKCTFKHTTWKGFCDAYRRQCPEIKPPDFNFGIPDSTIHFSRNFSATILDHLGPNVESSGITNCGYITPPLTRYCKSTTWVQAPKGGYPYTCFSLFSLFEHPYEEAVTVNINSMSFIQMDMHPEEYVFIDDLVQAWVVLHDPRKLVNPMAEGITLTAGTAYVLYPTIEKTERLPPPYDSKCKDYLNEWKKNGGVGPLSKMDCIELCKIKAMNDERGCVGWSITYPNMYTICQIPTYDTPPEVNRMCTSSCRDACEEKSYSFTTETAFDLKSLCNSTDEYCKHRDLKIEVSFSRMKVQKSKQVPRFESIELVSHIGGYLGMWLGISVASVFDVFEKIYDVIAHLHQRKKKIQKTRTLVEQFRHHTVLNKRRKIVKKQKLY